MGLWQKAGVWELPRKGGNEKEVWISEDKLLDTRMCPSSFILRLFIRVLCDQTIWVDIYWWETKDFKYNPLFTDEKRGLWDVKCLFYYLTC